MIRLSKEDYNQVITDEELEFLANAYLKLKSNAQFKKFSKDFQNFIVEYLDEELLDANDILHPEDRKEKANGK